MPRVTFFREGIGADAAPGENLRELAQRAGVPIYRSFHVLLNCKGRGKCGSCRVELSDPGAVEPCERTGPEHRHLDRGFSDATTRLACQVTVCADISVLTQEVAGRRVETKGFIPRGF